MKYRAVWKSVVLSIIEVLLLKDEFRWKPNEPHQTTSNDNPTTDIRKTRRP